MFFRHQAREAEPKDYVLSEAPERDLLKSTYKHLGNSAEGPFPPTTYQAQCNDLKDAAYQGNSKNPDFEMISVQNFDLCDPGRYGNILLEKELRQTLPDYDPSRKDRMMDTKSTYQGDYTREFTPSQSAEKEDVDLSIANRKCLSQFTDTANHRRPGRNTWWDESGVYANSHVKRQVTQPTDPLAHKTCCPKQ